MLNKQTSKQTWILGMIELPAKFIQHTIKENQYHNS